MTRLDRMIVAQLSSAVQAFFARLVILQILLPLLAFFSFALPLRAQQPLNHNAGRRGEIHNAGGKALSGAVVAGHAATAITQADGSFSSAAFTEQSPPSHAPFLP
jgi:hypothetical protein